MPVLTMYRDGEIAYVNTDHAATYDNFLANGWADKQDTPTREPASDALPEAAEEAPPETDAPVRAPRKAK